MTFEVARQSLMAWLALGYQREAAKRTLAIVSKAFRLSEMDGLRLRPDDEVWVLCRHYYPPRTGWRRQIGLNADELEMEALQDDLERAVPGGTKVDLHPAVTFGHLVKLLHT